MSNPEVIVVAEQSIYDVLVASGVQWNVQNRVGSVAEMWAGLADGSLSGTSSILFFSDSLEAAPGELETAVATMAPHSTVFIPTWSKDGATGLSERIRAQAAIMNTDGPFYFVPTHDEKSLLNGIKSVLHDHTSQDVAFPEVWAEGVTGLLHGTVDGPSDGVAPVEVAPVEVAPVEVAPVEVAISEPLAEPSLPEPLAPIEPVAVVAPVQPVQPVQVARVQPVAPPSVVRPPVSQPQPTTPQAPARPGPVARPAQASSLGMAREGGGPADGYQAPAKNTTLCFFSSKGGSGKSTTALMTATSIAHCSEQAGKPLKVVLVDMDTRDGQVASLVGQYAPTALNIRVAEDWDEATVLKNLVHSEKLKIDCLLAPIRPRTADDVGPDFYRHVIRILQQTHDVVIMDCSVNYLDPLISTVCLPEAKAVLFVTTMATTAVQGMARALREITEPVDKGGMGIPRSKIGIVVNQSVQNVGLDKEQVTQAALSVPLVGAIPLATTDVLTATNTNKMHFLVKHPVLGPAYARLARVCVPNAELADMPGAPTNVDSQPTPIAEQTPAPAPIAPVPGMAPVPAPGVIAPPASPEPVGVSTKKVGRKLLGRKKD